MKTDACEWMFVNIFRCKGHFCHSSFTKNLIDDLKSRYKNISDEQILDDDDEQVVSKRNECMMILSNLFIDINTFEKISVDGLDITIPSSDFIKFVNKLTNSTQRMFFDGQKYYKVHGKYACIIFTEEQRKYIIDNTINTVLRLKNENAQSTDNKLVISFGEGLVSKAKWMIHLQKIN